MICPMMSGRECMKDDCAWWVRHDAEEHERYDYGCAVWQIGYHIEEIPEKLHAIGGDLGLLREAGKGNAQATAQALWDVLHGTREDGTRIVVKRN